ncbi:MAG: hypothetical protein ACOYM3_05065 [Terrimicrobiaceae bacterium]
MRALIFLLLIAGLGGCAPSYFLSFSNGYNPATSYTYSLPSIALAPGQSRKAFVRAPGIPFARTSSVRIATEDPAVVRIWEPRNPQDIVRIEAVAPGAALVHRGDFPFPDWNAHTKPLKRTAWRGELRKYLRPQPDDVTFRALSDSDLWTAVLRTRSRGALRVVVEEDRLQYP